MDYNFLKLTKHGLVEYAEIISGIERFAEEEIFRGELGKYTNLYEVRGFLGDKTHIEIEPVIEVESAASEEERQEYEGVYIQIHTPWKIPRKINRMLTKSGYQSIPLRPD